MDLPNILTKLSFAKDKSKLRRPTSASMRRAGPHAMQAMRRGDFPRLRTASVLAEWTIKAITSPSTSWATTSSGFRRCRSQFDTLLAGCQITHLPKRWRLCSRCATSLLGLAAGPETDRRRILSDFGTPGKLPAWRWSISRRGTTFTITRGDGEELRGEVDANRQRDVESTTPTCWVAKTCSCSACIRT